MMFKWKLFLTDVLAILGSPIWIPLVLVVYVLMQIAEGFEERYMDKRP